MVFGEYYCELCGQGDMSIDEYLGHKCKSHIINKINYSDTDELEGWTGG